MTNETQAIFTALHSALNDADYRNYLDVAPPQTAYPYIVYRLVAFGHLPHPTAPESIIDLRATCISDDLSAALDGADVLDGLLGDAGTLTLPAAWLLITSTLRERVQATELAGDALPIVQAGGVYRLRLTQA